MRFDPTIHKWATIDFESNYDKSKKLTITEGAYPYFNHPDFEAYLVSTHLEQPSVAPVDTVGHPTQFDWHSLDGAYLSAHNAGFDSGLFDHLVSKGLIYDPIPPPGEDRESRWLCTADLAAFLQCPRSLAGAVEALYGVSVDKGMRSWMNKRTWADAVAAGKDKALMKYAMDDTLWSARILREHVMKWPDFERRLSVMTRRMMKRGVFVDTKALDDGINTLSKVVFDAEHALPWTSLIDPKTKEPYPPLSTPGLHNECAKHDIPPPDSRAKDSEELEEWMNQYGNTHAFVSAMGVYQQANGHLQKLIVARKRIEPSGRMQYGLKYFGADTTGRWAGDNGFNVQNLPRKPKFGVDLRGILHAEPGHVFVIADMSQIEPRSLAWLAKDTEFLDLIRKGFNPYEAHALDAGSWTPMGGKLADEDPDTYSMSKVEILGFGYGAGFEKVPTIAQTYGAHHLLEKPVTKEMLDEFFVHLGKYSPLKLENVRNQSEADIRVLCNSWHKVQGYRQKRHRVPALWRKMDNMFKATETGDTFIIRLPSGREMIYFDVRPGSAAGESYTACTERGGIRRKWYGANLVQNACQAFARDTFAYAMLQLEDLGLRPVLQIHDEVVVECRIKDADTVADTVRRVLSTPPPYISTFPLGCSVKIADRYLK